MLDFGRRIRIHGADIGRRVVVHKRIVRARVHKGRKQEILDQTSVVAVVLFTARGRRQVCHDAEQTLERLDSV